MLHAHSGGKHRIKNYYGCYDPLQYPLFFPKGQMGWNPQIIRGQVNNQDNSQDLSSIDGLLQREQQLD